MSKGMFMAGVALLTDGETTLDDVKAALLQGGFAIAKEVSPSSEWQMGGPGVVVPFRPEVNGYAVVDLIGRPWPDSMGDARTDPGTFGAWSLGRFGPLAFPGGLARSAEQAWLWAEAPDCVEQHRGFIRILLSYVFGASGSLPIAPRDYDPVAELDFLSDVSRALLGAPGVLCYFNPNGEVLADEATFGGMLEEGRAAEEMPLPLWMNVRFYRPSEEFGLMETVGNGQLDVRDVEAIFPLDEYEPDAVAQHLRNVTHYLIDLKEELTSGESIDGPGEDDLGWTMEVLDESALQPPRRVLRIYPQRSAEAVRTLFDRSSAD